MRLKTLVLKNFRSYRDEIRIPFDDLTAFIGKNDVGKSTILEALELFFNGNSSSIVKMESTDACVFNEDKSVVIGCVFTDLPDHLVLDTQTVTTLSEEFLLNDESDLELHKVWDCRTQKPSETVCAVAKHPTVELASDLLDLTNVDLKKRALENGIDLAEIDRRSNPALRAAIRAHIGELGLTTKTVPLNKKDAKNTKTIWGSLEKELPQFALFQADRPSKEDDSEVQDPMKLAITEAIKSVEQKLSEVKETVRVQVTEVAKRTLEKLKEMDPELAGELAPHFKSEPKWDGLFKLSLTSDDEIPINKRGSGVRRLILLNFFRAEAERRLRTDGGSGIIYAIEEPETAQHPNNQKMLVSALKSLSMQPNCQVVLTTHVPGLAGLLDTSSIRYVDVQSDGTRSVSSGNDDVYLEVARQLGVLPDSRVRVILCVEGPNDVQFLKRMSSMLHGQDPSVINLELDPRVVVLHLGGSTLKDWVQGNYLRELGKPEVHIYDRDDDSTPKYQRQHDEVNRRRDGSIAFITGKREMENYIHPDAIEEEYGFRIEFSDMDDVPELVAKAAHSTSSSDTAWEDLRDEKTKKKISHAKGRLNSSVAARMTVERLQQSDPSGEILMWLSAIGSLIVPEEVVARAAASVATAGHPSST